MPSRRRRAPIPFYSNQPRQPVSRAELATACSSIELVAHGALPVVVMPASCKPQHHREPSNLLCELSSWKSCGPTLLLHEPSSLLPPASK